MSPGKRIPRVLSIAGSDSGGGAGIQADLKAFAACGVHGMTALTAITAQNTAAVTAVHTVPAEVIDAQVKAVAQDIGIDAVKIGMLGTVGTIKAVADALDGLAAPVVVDPVLLAESGAVLLEPEAHQALVELLLPRAMVATPNVPEARALTGLEQAEPAELARAVLALGPGAVVVTGGHLDNATDTFYDGKRMVELPGERHASAATHGSGCTHSAVLACALAWEWEPLDAARLAREFSARAVAHGLAELGSGAGPVDMLGCTGVEPALP
jgi:hydroxymethylpyrimidine/phosphomethylpyrimidine kinase